MNTHSASIFKIVFFVLTIIIVFILLRYLRNSKPFHTSNIIKIILFMVAIFIIYKTSKNPIIIFLSSKTIPKELQSYKSIDEAPLIYDNYEITPLFSSKKKRYNIRFPKRDLILYDSVNNHNYIMASGKSDDDITVYLKLNHHGDMIDSISVNQPRLFNSGVFFYHDYYIDWFRSSETTRKGIHILNMKKTYL